ncbi:hypothetical protein I308_104571 [Cryptococcus tetragattii IND107]|uniref:D-serine dehydratase-like domain-containing protein n=1 Tax=Cryptococcus tetragattii IND107 TaxID=1296105 RepID=A0ABR3BMZ9_9TREE
MSTFTSLSLYSLPSKSALVDEFVGQPLSALRTPALIVDRKKFKDNCERVASNAKERGMKFRAHVKTHKTTEGTRMQVEAAGGVKATIASTMVEVWQIIEAGLVKEGLVDDILYSMPISADKLEDINSAQEIVGKQATIRIMVDHAEQIKILQAFSQKIQRSIKWSVFVKVDGGGKRAGAPAENYVEIFGFYSHFGQSYASDSLSAGSSYFAGEINCVQTAAKIARNLGAKGKWILSVGATPTAHAAVQEAVKEHGGLEGELELHAGCYCMCDLQQCATSLVSYSRVAISVLGRVVSVYPLRKEAMCDVGALSVSKDTGRFPGFGRVVEPDYARGWDLGRISQEHGTLVHRQGEIIKEENELKIGDSVQIIPQHACLVCACFPWFYVVDDGRDEVVDVWVPWKGW